MMVFEKEESTRSVKGEKLRDESGSTRVPRNVRREGTLFQDRNHVPNSVCVFRVLLQHL